MYLPSHNFWLWKGKGNFSSEIIGQIDFQLNHKTNKVGPNLSESYTKDDNFIYANKTCWDTNTCTGKGQWNGGTKSGVRSVAFGICLRQDKYICPIWSHFEHFDLIIVQAILQFQGSVNKNEYNICLPVFGSF